MVINYVVLIYYCTLFIVHVAKNDFVGKVRKDRRCGSEFPLPGNQGLPSECDGNSENFCCSKVPLLLKLLFIHIYCLQKC